MYKEICDSLFDALMDAQKHITTFQGVSVTSMEIILSGIQTRFTLGQSPVVVFKVYETFRI